MKEKHLLAEFTSDTACQFFETGLRLGINNDPEKKHQLFLAFIKEGKAVRAWITGRSKEEILKDLAKNYGTILNIEPKKEG